jgi:uncharacterized protein
MPALIGNTQVLRGLSPSEFTDEAFGLPTVNDILKELEKPGRDPRPEFETATFKEGVETLADLEEGMILEGQVTNVAAFGAFVDIGVHQDGLVHVSAMSNSFVTDPRDVAKPGDVVQVKVLSVDIPRKRISLTMRLEDPADGGQGSGGGPRGGRTGKSSDKPASRTLRGDSSGPASSPRGGDRRGGSGQSERGQSERGQSQRGQGERGQGERGDRRGRSGDGRGNGSRGDSAPRGGNDSRGGNGPRGGGGDRGGNRGGSGGSAPAPANSAMAEALRKAGLVGGDSASGGRSDRRSDRP